MGDVRRTVAFNRDVWNVIMENLGKKIQDEHRDVPFNEYLNEVLREALMDGGDE
jgi:hypothetical protein